MIDLTNLIYLFGILGGTINNFWLLYMFLKSELFNVGVI